MLLFSGADAMCATGDPVYSTPYLLAKKAGQRLQMEFLYHNKFSGRIHSLCLDLLILCWAKGREGRNSEEKLALI